jgi:hypothetical protein
MVHRNRSARSVTTSARGTHSRRAAPHWNLGRAGAVGLLALLSLAVPAMIFGTAAAAPTASCSAHISHVSAISATKLSKTITIKGTCFGTGPSYISLSPYGYTGQDTYNCGTGSAPAMHIVDYAGGSSDWSAGREWGTNGTCMNLNLIGLNYKSWSNTKIVISGFGNALGTCSSSATWKICANQHISVNIFNPPVTSGYGANYTVIAT